MKRRRRHVHGAHKSNLQVTNSNIICCSRWQQRSRRFCCLSIYLSEQESIQDQSPTNRIFLLIFMINTFQNTVYWFQKDLSKLNKCIWQKKDLVNRFKKKTSQFQTIRILCLFYVPGFTGLQIHNIEKHVT